MTILDTAKSMFNGIISKILVKAIKKHLNIDTGVDINEIGVSELSKTVIIHFNGDIVIPKENVLELVKKIGL